MYICVCNAVNESRIAQAASEGVETIKGLCARTGAGTCCGKCLPEAKRVLEQALYSQASNALEAFESAA